MKKTINDVLEMIQGKGLSLYTESQIEAICIKEGYFVHYGGECKDYYKNKLSFISNPAGEYVGYLLSYRCKTKDITVKAYGKHITKSLNEDSRAPKGILYKKVVKPIYFKYMREGEETEGWIINSEEFKK